ncbi:MAG: alpha/beta hydrolase [Planctomycetota bacterium]
MAWIVKGMVRAARIPALGFVLAACGAAAVGGCFRPPVVFPVGPGMGIEGERNSLTRIELTLDDGTTLGGVHESAGEGAPLVLHLMEADGGVGWRLGPSDRYDRLADLGLSSMAFDYRGVGLSGGSRRSGRMLDDTRTVYRHALASVGGDEDRLIVRASSIGTTMVAALLAEGARPRAVVAFGPVESATLARRYAAQFWWSPLYWPIAPFLKRLVDVSTLEELAAAPCPVLVVTDPEDCFLSAGEVARLQADAASRETLLCVIPAKKTRSPDVSAPGFQRHVSVVRRAYELRPFEERFLVEHAVDAAVVDARVTTLLAAAPAEARTRIEADAAARARLRTLAIADRRIFPEAAAAAALQLRNDEVEAAKEWVASRWFRFGAAVLQGRYDPYSVGSPRTFEEFLGTFDLADGEGGRWPVADVLRARSFLNHPGVRNEAWVWTEANLRALSLALDGRIEEAQALAESARFDAQQAEGDAPVSWLELEQRSGDLLWVETHVRGGSMGRTVIPAVFTTDLESFLVLLRRGEGALPLLRKAAWWP